MRKLLSVALGGLLSVGTGGAAALAEDGPGGKWSGLYFGGHVGYSFLSPDAFVAGEIEDAYELSDLVLDTSRTPPREITELDSLVNHSFSNSLEGAVGGGHLGYNFQRGQFVFGVEGDYSFMDSDGSSVSITPDPKLTNPFVVEALEEEETEIEEGNPSLRIGGSIEYLASLRGRVGFALSPWVHAYGTGGVAWTEFDFGGTATTEESTDSFHFSKRLTGWVAGGGAEFRLDPKLSMRVEVLHYDFGDVSYTVKGVGKIEVLEGSFDVSTTVARVGASYHLN
jgi:outer membrane immunogenic protein